MCTLTILQFMAEKSNGNGLPQSNIDVNSMFRHLFAININRPVGVSESKKTGMINWINLNNVDDACFGNSNMEKEKVLP